MKIHFLKQNSLKAFMLLIKINQNKNLEQMEESK